MGGKIEGPGGTYRPFGEALPTLDEALVRLLAETTPLEGIEYVGLGEAVGRVLAGRVESPHDLPGFDRSTVDGYAVRSRDVAAAGSSAPGGAGFAELEWAGEVRMGHAATSALQPGQAISVATGAMLPEGADAVVMVEDTSVANGKVRVHKPVRPGENVLPKGSDLRAGETVVPPGTRLGPAQVGALAGAGCVEVPVAPRPVVAVIATGDELVPPHRDPEPGRIRDMNSHALVAALLRDGALPRWAGRVHDEPQDLTAAVESAAAGADLVLISGGSSVGTRDVTVDAFERVGGRLLLHGIALKPGKPTIVSRLGDVLLVGLPGNPVSALVVYDVLVRPVLLAKMRVAEPLRQVCQTARLERDIRRPKTREELVRVRLREEKGERIAAPVPGSSGMLQSLARADGYVWVPFSREGFMAGEPVEVRLTGWF